MQTRRQQAEDGCLEALPGSCPPLPQQPSALKHLTSCSSFIGRVEFYRLMFHSLVSNIPPNCIFLKVFYFLIGVCTASPAIGYSNSISHFTRGEEQRPQNLPQ